MKYYFQKAIFPVIYLILTAITGFAGLSFSNELLALKIIIGVVNLFLYSFFVAYSSYKNGEDAMGVRYGNDLARKEIVRTGRDLKLKVHEEYKVWKGFFLGFLSCVPLIVLWIVHLIIIAVTGESASVVGGFTMMLYVVVIFFFNLNVDQINSSSGFYYTALYLPYMVILSGIFYILGARKTWERREIANRKLQDIYGDDKH